jgi:hypothetical protein
MSPPPTATHATAHPTLNAAQQALVDAKKLEATRKKRMSEEKKRKSLVTPSSTQSVNTKSTPPSNLPKPFQLAKALNRTPASPNNNPETLLATTSSPNRLSVLESDPNGSETFATQENAFEHLEDQEHLYGDLNNADLEKPREPLEEKRSRRQNPKLLQRKQQKLRLTATKKLLQLRTHATQSVPSRTAIQWRPSHPVTPQLQPWPRQWPNCV